MLRRVTSYGLKNFQGHMGIQSNITLGGLLRRTARRYPRAWGAAKKGGLLCGIYIVMMSFIPGSALPLQTTTKLSLLALSRTAAQLWYYNAFAPEPNNYLIKLNELILQGLDQQIYDIRFLSSYLGEIREVVEEEKKGLKQSCYLDLLLYSEIILQNVVRYEKRVLLERDLYDYYDWVCAAVFDRVLSVSEKEDKHIKLAYSIVQFLLNFAPEGRVPNVIHTYHRLVNRPNVDQPNSFAGRVMKAGLQQTAFIKSLKQVYSSSQDPQLKKQIFQIFEHLDALYRSNK